MKLLTVLLLGLTLVVATGCASHTSLGGQRVGFSAQWAGDGGAGIP